MKRVLKHLISSTSKPKRKYISQQFVIGNTFTLKYLYVGTNMCGVPKWGSHIAEKIDRSNVEVFIAEEI